MSEQRLVKDFQDLQVGDKVVYTEGESYGRESLLKKVIVEKVTPTRFNAGGMQFNKRDGYKWGWGSSWGRHPRIMGRLGQKHLFTWDQADERNEKIKAEIEREAYINRIQSFKFRDLDIDTIKQVASVLGIEIKQENTNE